MAVHTVFGDDLRDDDMDYALGIRVNDEVVYQLRGTQWVIPPDFLQESHFRRVVQDLDWTSSPGYPYLCDFPTNRIFFQHDGYAPSEEALQRIWLLVLNRLKVRDSDPIRLFVKPEPLNSKKASSGRYRLISSVSVIDQIIDHMIFSPFNKKLIENCHYTPIKTGWTPYVGGWRQVPLSGVVSCDKSAWDWTVKPWIIQAELRLRISMCLNISEEWIDLAKWRYQKLFFDNTFVTSQGDLLKQKTPGVMKSGCVNTIASNSLMQLILHTRVAIELDKPLGFIWVMGDDVMQSTQDEAYFDLLSQYCILKEVTPRVEFAGFSYHGARVEPNYRGKHAFNLLNQRLIYLPETAVSYSLLYHRSKYRDAMRKMLRQVTDDIPSRNELDRIWDGE